MNEDARPVKHLKQLTILIPPPEFGGQKLIFDGGEGLLFFSPPVAVEERW